MSDETTRGAIRIGDLLVEPGARTVSRGAQSIDLPRLSFDLLLALIEAAPDALSTEDLMERVWTGRVVTPQTVAKRVELLRQALGDDATESRYVTLVRGYGYRLAQEMVASARPAVEPGPGDAAGEPYAGASQHPASGMPRRMLLAYALAAAILLLALVMFLLPRDDAPAAAPERSVAVLPFKALGDDPADQWFADGLTEEVALALVRTGDLDVAGRTSARAFRDASEDARVIGETLGVAYLLEGTVRRQGGRLRIVTRLTDTRDGFEQWNQVFEASAGDTSSVYQRIARQVATRFQLEPAPAMLQNTAATSSNPDAYALYLQAVSLSAFPRGEDLEQAQSLAEQVVDLDPGFAPGWTRLAIVHGRRLFFDPAYPLDQDTAIRTIRSAIDRALAIDPEQGEAYAALASLAWTFERDPERAARLLERAIRLDPWNLDTLNVAASFSRAVGHLDQARDLSAYVVRRDPLCATCRTFYAGVLSCQGEFEAAERELRKIRDEDVEMPLDFDFGKLALEQGKLEEAERYFSRIEYPEFHRLGEIWMLVAHGDRAEANQALERHRTEHPRYGFYQAPIALKLGNPDLAVALYRGRLPERYVWVQHAATCLLDTPGLQSSTSWQALMRDLDLPAHSQHALRLDIPTLPGEKTDH